MAKAVWYRSRPGASALVLLTLLLGACSVYVIDASLGTDASYFLLGSSMAEKKTLFETTDEKVVLLVKFNNNLVASNRRFHVDWIDPDQRVYLSDPAGATWGNNQYLIAELGIANHEPSMMPGRWQVKLYMEEQLLVARTFRIGEQPHVGEQPPVSEGRSRTASRLGFRFDDREWRVSSQRQTSSRTSIEWTPEGQPRSGTELVSWELFDHASRTWTMERIRDRHLESLGRYCPSLDRKIIRESDLETVYEWYLDVRCDGRDPHHMVARILVGDAAIHWLAYISKGQRLEDAERDRWVQTLSRIDLAPMPFPELE